MVAVSQATAEVKTERAWPISRSGRHFSGTDHSFAPTGRRDRSTRRHGVAADIHDESVRLRLQRMVALVVPLITIVMGIMVAGIVARC